uniref:Small ribosomal subunit protein uS9m n=1 Tax=Bos taurus TaxID=9913 RepID=A0AAF6YPR5_BOVIN
MAAPSVSCGAAVPYRLFLAGRVSFAREQGLWKAAASGLQTGTRCQILRLKHSPAVTTTKNVAALRRESYTVDFIKKQIEEFNIGKRHLANMMGEDPETFTQEDVDASLSMGFSRQEYWNGLPCPPPGDLPDPRDRTQGSCIAGRFFTSGPAGEALTELIHVVFWRLLEKTAGPYVVHLRLGAVLPPGGEGHLETCRGDMCQEHRRAITYLFPSGLFEKRARPIMKHPEEIFPKQRAVQWGEDGRPFHFLFYTGKQSYYSLMHEAYGKVLHAEERQDQLRAKGLFSEKSKSKDLIGSRWLIKEELEEMLVEKLSDQDYAQFIRLLERLSALPCDAAEEEFVGRFRRTVTVQSKKHLIEPLQYDEQGMAFSTGQGKRKTANAEAVVYGHGSGKIEINGVDYLLYFPVTQDREQLMFPFHFLDRLGKHDVTCTVSGGGRSSQAGAIRLAMSRALCSFITEDEVEWMRQAGLLTTDPRVRERKKPGQEGARRKFTWKKR